MTKYQRNLLENNLKKFKSFIDFVKFTFEYDIEFEHEEWEEFRDKFFETKQNGSVEILDVKLDNFILPN